MKEAYVLMPLLLQQHRCSIVLQRYGIFLPHTKQFKLSDIAEETQWKEYN